MKNNGHIIEIFYFEDCPSWETAQAHLSAALQELDMDIKIELIAVETQQAAEKYQFTGSPMIRVNGRDLFPTGQDQYALGCRVYETPEGIKGWPTKEMLREKLRTTLFRNS